RESQHMAQMAMSAEAGNHETYVDDAETAAAEAAELAAQMGALAEDCGSSTEAVAQLAQIAAAQAAAAVAQAEALREAADTASAEADAPVDGAPVLIDEPPTDPVEHAASLVLQLTSPSFVPDNVLAAQLTASALMQIIAAYDDTTAAQLEQPLAYWTHIAEQHLTEGTWLEEGAPGTTGQAGLTAPVAPQTSPFWSIGDREATGQDFVYEWLPADVAAAAQASTGGHVLLASSDQITTVQAHLDEQSLVFIEKLVTENVNAGEGGSTTVQVLRQVAVPTFQAAAELGLSGAELAAYAEANRAYLLSDGTVGTAAAFEAAERRPPTEDDRAYIVAAPTQYGGEGGNVSTPASIGNQATYLWLIGLSASTPRDLTISFNNSYSGDGDASLDTSHRTFDLTQPNSRPSGAYHAIANDELAGAWVQIGDKGPIGDDVGKMLEDIYEELGADTPEKQEVVRSMLFRYDPNYGVIANRELIAAAVEMNNGRRQGFFENGIGRALILAAATFVGGPILAAGVSAAFASADGGSFVDVLRAGAAAYLGGLVGANVGNFVTSSLATSGLNATVVGGLAGFSQGVTSSFTSQLIATGRIDADALLTAGIAGGVGGAVTTALSGTDLMANIDQTLGLAPGTAARL
ncbi:MAG TPA: hypothetical protein VLC93_10175, partial [Myxococcota bacterium]|nr:hypothetical protein [Myxococcota bacterium]